MIDFKIPGVIHGLLNVLDCFLDNVLRGAWIFNTSVKIFMNCAKASFVCIEPKATVGPCNVSKPGFFDFQGRQKWEAWKKLDDMSKEEAKQEYVDQMTLIDPGWQNATQGQESKPLRSTFGGVVVSCMQHPNEKLVPESEKTVFDWVVDGNTKQVEACIESGGVDLNHKDDQDMALLHWACDRGHYDIADLLLRSGADVDIKDGDEQTPLHYASSCDHADIVKLLMHHHADVSHTDIGGSTAADLASSEHIIQILKTK